MFALSSRNPNAQPISAPSATEKQAMGGAENKPEMFEQPNHLFQQMNDAKDGCVNTSPSAELADTVLGKRLLVDLTDIASKMGHMSVHRTPF